jgi:hypothetical protein
MMLKLITGLTLVGCAALPASAQFSSDFPGVPRGMISVRGGTQSRTEWTFTGRYVPKDYGPDTIAGGLRLGIGRSYRIRGRFEWGYDFTLLDGAVNKVIQGGATANQPAPDPYARGLVAYGIRLGAKFSPYSVVDPDGNGTSISFGGGFQPSLHPLYGIEAAGDAHRSGSQFGTKEPEANPAFSGNPFARLRASTILAAMGSYRSRRLLGDLAVMTETVGNREAGEDPSPIQEFNGFSVRAGAAFRLTRSIALGGSYWGKGAPPWRDDVNLGMPGEVKVDNYAFLIQFGSSPEKGVDLMFTAPTGDYAQSGRLYIRKRSTH